MIGYGVRYAVSAILLQLILIDGHRPFSHVGNPRLHSTRLDHSSFYGSRPFDRALFFSCSDCGTSMVIYSGHTGHLVNTIKGGKKYTRLLGQRGVIVHRLRVRWPPHTFTTSELPCSRDHHAFYTLCSLFSYTSRSLFPTHHP